MELKKKYIHMSHEKGRALSQVTMDDDYNVPESKPDVMSIITSRGELRMEEIKAEKNRVILQGNLCFEVLYRSEEKDREISALSGCVPFTENINLEGAEEFDPVKVKWDIEDLNVGIINSRKLSVRGLVVFDVSIHEIRDAEISYGMENEDDYEVQKERIQALQLVSAKKDTCRFKNEVILPGNKPNIGEMLWKNVEIRGLETKIEDDVIRFNGEMLMYILYRPDEENAPLEWLEETLPLHGEVSCTGCSKNQLSYVGIEDMVHEIEVKPDYDGEARIIYLDAMLELDIKLWEEEEVELLKDIYSLKKEVKPVHDEMVFENLLMKNYAKCRVSERLQLEDSNEEILQITSAKGTVQIDNHEISGNGVYVEGNVAVELMYITQSDEMPIGAVTRYLPFHQTIEVPGITENSRYEFETGIEQMTTILMDNRQVEVKVVINLNLIAFSRKTCKNLTDVEEGEADYEALQRIPGLVGYVVTDKEELWDIAKCNHTTVSDIMSTNNLATPTVRKGDKLLIVKSMGA